MPLAYCKRKKEIFKKFGGETANTGTTKDDCPFLRTEINH